MQTPTFRVGWRAQESFADCVVARVAAVVIEREGRAAPGAPSYRVLAAFAQRLRCAANPLDEPRRRVLLELSQTLRARRHGSFSLLAVGPDVGDAEVGAGHELTDARDAVSRDLADLAMGEAQRSQEGNPP